MSSATVMLGPSSRRRAWILISFLAVAALQSWPLPLHLGDRLTGDPGGDTGVYVWNPWVFRHQLVERGTNPFTTDLILAAEGPTDLSLHNYTVASNLMALPLLSIAGVVTSFNLIYLFNVAMAGMGMFLLVRHLHRHATIGDAEAWLAGLLFACSPFLVARGNGHFSLVAAAPLPFFVLCFDRVWRDHRIRDAVGAGACVAWAAYSDPYYAVYCVLLALCIAASDLTVGVSRATAGVRPAGIILDSLLVAAPIVIIAVAAFDVTRLDIGPVHISMRSLYTPVLVLTVLIGARTLMIWRPRIRWQRSATPGQMVRDGAVIAAVGAVLLAPLLYAMLMRVLDGRMVTAPVLWRSSASGLDVLAFLAPNPNHPLAPPSLMEWLSAQPGLENVASIPWVALAVIIAAWRWSASPVRRMWLCMAVFFALLALGPFVHVGGVLTYVPTPWTLLRYVPILGEARMPARFGVLVIMAVAILFAGALVTLAHRSPNRRRVLLGVVGAALVFEILPVPRTLYSAEIPAIYQTIASDPRPVAVLELPFGIKDGLTFFGDFTPRSQFHQTLHGKPLVGGYLSRVSDRRKAAYLASPILGPLIELSEGNPIDAAARAAAPDGAARLVAQVRLGYVVMHTARTPPALRELAMDVFALEPAGVSDGYELFRGGSGP